MTAGKGSLEKIMGDIFISYAHEDRAAAERVAAALKRHGWAVWWDPDIAPGDVWDQLIEQKLAAASCVVVLWSGTSVHKQWVKAEATEAQARGILVPVLIEDVKPPLAFRQIQAAHLAEWRGEREHCGFQQLLCTVCGLLESQTTPVLRGPRQSWREPPFADDRAAGDMIYGFPAARPAEPSRAQAAMPTGLPLVPMLPNAGILTPQSPKPRSNTKKGAAEIVALVLLGAVIGYALHEPLNVLLGGL